MKIVEATLLMPLTCLIMISLIGLGMFFFNELNLLIEENAVKDEKIYKIREVSIIRTYDRVRYELEG